MVIEIDEISMSVHELVMELDEMVIDRMLMNEMVMDDEMVVNGMGKETRGDIKYWLRLLSRVPLL